MNLFYYSPLLMAKISCFLKYFHKAKMTTKNDYGTIPNILSPDEGGKIWSHLLPEMNGTHYVPQGSCSKQQINEIRRVILGIKGFFNRPFLNKRPSISVGLAPISEAFPRALYIVLFRDPVFNAQSLYIARHKFKEKVDDKGWFLCKPQEYVRISSDDYIVQSVSQVYYILKQIDNDRKLLENRMMWLRYEDLCEKPAMILDLISNFMEQHKLKVLVNEGFNIPSISHSNVRKIDVEIFSRLKCEVDRIFNGWKPKISKGD